MIQKEIEQIKLEAGDLGDPVAGVDTDGDGLLGPARGGGLLRPPPGQARSQSRRDQAGLARAGHGVSSGPSGLSGAGVCRPG